MFSGQDLSGPMWQLFILVEGPTEETFVKQVLSPYLIQFNIYATPIIAKTKQLANSSKIRGGVNTTLVLEDLKRMVHNMGPRTIVTTLFDYYGLPTDFPGLKDKPQGNSLKIVQHLEQSLADSVGSQPPVFLPYIQLHEFETLLFVEKEAFATYVDPTEANLNELYRIIDRYPNPEDINNDPMTAPSKRILKHFPGYNKAIDGSGIIREIGLDLILLKCPHFKEWIDKIQTIASA